MKDFWPLLKAELTVELLSKTLFSGKHPRILAVLFTLVLVWIWIFYSLLKIIWRIIRLFYPTKRMKTKQILRLLQKKAKSYHDIPGEMQKTAIGYDMSISIQANQRLIQTLIFSIDSRNGKMEIQASTGRESYLLQYDFLSHYSGYKGYSLHESNALHLYESLHLNYL